MPESRGEWGGASHAGEAGDTPDTGSAGVPEGTLDVLVLALAAGDGFVDVAIAASAVEEVVRVDRVTPYPGAPPDLGGVAAVRGRVVLVLDVAPSFPRVAAGTVLPAGSPAVLVTDGTRRLALRGGTPVRLAAARLDAAPVRASVDGRPSITLPPQLRLWSGRGLPLAGTVRLADAPRSDAADRSVLPLLDVAALCADVIEGSEGGA